MSRLDFNNVQNQAAAVTQTVQNTVTVNPATSPDTETPAATTATTTTSESPVCPICLLPILLLQPSPRLRFLFLLTSLPTLFKATLTCFLGFKWHYHSCFHDRGVPFDLHLNNHCRRKRKPSNCHSHADYSRDNRNDG
jgi:hypothetical protein